MMKLIPGFVIVVFFSIALILSYITWTTLFRRNLTNSFETDNNFDTVVISPPRSVYDNLVPQLRSIENVLPKLTSVDEETLFGPGMLKNAERLRMKIVSNLRRHVIDGSGFKGHINHYGVNFTTLKRIKQDPKAMLCKIKQLKFSILNEKSSTIFRGKMFPKDSLLDGLTLFGGVGGGGGDFEEDFEEKGNYPKPPRKSESRDDPLYKTCAVIPSSAALDGSQHGIDIDSHEFIIRFNNAPTKSYEEDVGSLTSMRIVNSQVVTKTHFGFPHSSFFNSSEKAGNKSQSEEDGNSDPLDAIWSSTKKFLIWDPCNYTSTLAQWVESPEFPVFDKYFNLTSRVKEFGQNRFYMLDCRVIWKLWELLFEYTFQKIYGTPPTSGFIGIVLALQNCERVNVYEYIPSVRESARCHYYGPKNESNPSCTYGSWHPVSAEKLFFLGISDSPDKQIFYDGVLSLPGVSTVKC